MFAMNKASRSLISRLAWRETRKQRGKLFLYMSAIVIGVAALVSVQSVGKNLSAAVSAKSKSLLGADLRLQARQAIPPAVDTLFQPLITGTATQTQFTSMTSNPTSKQTRFSSITAVSSAFPLHGELELTTGHISEQFFTQPQAVIDEALSIQLDLNIGDSIKIGFQNFYVHGFLKRLPGESIAVAFAPRVIIPHAFLAKTRLIQHGSVVNYSRLYSLSSTENIGTIVDEKRSILRKAKLRVTTEKSQQDQIQNAFTSLYKFLSLVGYVALILGGIGISSTIFVYLKGKTRSIAIMRSMGATSKQTLQIYAIQAIILGLLGSFIGVLLGLAIQFSLPAFLSNFIDIEFAAELSFSSIGSGFLIGLLTTLAFTILPILSIRTISPIQVIRESTLELNINRKTRFLFTLFIALFIASITYVQLGHVGISIGFTVFIGLGFSLLFLVASTLMHAVKKVYRKIPHLISRHAVASLFRPNNQTRTMLISIGLGVCLIGLLYFTQDSLLKNVQLGSGGERPNLLMIDIQPDQKKDYENFLAEHDLRFSTLLPIVPMKIVEVKGIRVDSLRKDTLRRNRRFRTNIRSTFASELRDTEEILSGKFATETIEFGDSIFVSIEHTFAERMGLALGDSLVFDVQGVPVTAYLGSLRKVDWRRAEPNFMVVFPDGALNAAPHTYVAVIKTRTRAESITVQRNVVAKFPNVSALDLQQMISAIEDIIDKISLVIQFMALFSIITGFIILAGGIISSRYQRMQEHVILRTIGAVKRQLQLLLVLEYSILGLLASVLGLILSYGASWMICTYWFKIAFLPQISTSLYIVLATVGTTLLIGLLNSRGITKQSPLEILRRET